MYCYISHCLNIPMFLNRSLVFHVVIVKVISLKTVVLTIMLT